MADGTFLRIARIEVDRELCIGAASCIPIAPDVFELDSENKAVVKPGTSGWRNSDEEIILAAKSCPTRAIFLYDENGNEIEY